MKIARLSAISQMPGGKRCSCGSGNNCTEVHRRAGDRQPTVEMTFLTILFAMTRDRPFLTRCS